MSTDSEVNYDFLTGIFNKNYLCKKLDSTLATMLGDNDIISMLNIDIDYFSNYIEKYGTDAGNNCLKNVADAVKSCLYRGQDFAARYDSDNFIAVLPYTPQSGAAIVAERVIESVRKLRIPHGKSDVSEIVTISVGIFSCQSKQDNAASKLFDESGKARDKAKLGGRNWYSSGDE